MSLASQLAALTTRIGTEFKSVRAVTGALSSLSTTDKTSLVAAINETKAGNGGSIDDATTSTSKTWSSSKTNSSISAAVTALVNGSGAALDTLKELADALGGDANYAATTAAALGNRVRVDAAQAFTSGQQTQGRSNIGAASATAVGDTEQDLVAAFNAAIA